MNLKDLKEMEVDWWRIVKILSAATISVFVGYKFHPMIENNSDAINTIVTIFSILAGFLIAVITFIAEPTLQRTKNWTDLQAMKDTIRRKLFRQKVLFLLYLITLGLALVMFLTPETYEELTKWLESIFLGLATFVFLASFSLPGSLMKIQMERYDASLEDNKPPALKDAIDKAKNGGNPAND